MHVHRSAHAHRFTVLPNSLLQDRRLSYTARGLLADLLSRRDGWREDGRQMADSSTQGRGTIRRALKELTVAGYYRVDRLRLPDGTIRSEAHVFDTPQLCDTARLEVPGVPRPAAGGAETGPADTPPVKNRVKEPSLPVVLPAPVELPSGPAPAARPAEAPAPDRVRAAALTLFRVLKPEPLLRLGESEAMELAPLVDQWLERGSTPGELARALLPGLPVPLHSPLAVLRDRLTRKMPPTRAPAQPAPSRAECTACHDPVPQPGLCRPCAGLGPRPPVPVGGGAALTAAGAALARAALRDARPARLACRA